MDLRAAILPLLSWLAHALQKLTVQHVQECTVTSLFIWLCWFDLTESDRPVTAAVLWSFILVTDHSRMPKPAELEAQLAQQLRSVQAQAAQLVGAVNKGT